MRWYRAGAGLVTAVALSMLSAVDVASGQASSDQRAWSTPSSRRAVTVDVGLVRDLLVDMPVVLPLAHTELQGSVERRREGRRGRVTVSGRIDAPSPGEFILSLNGNRLAGYVRTDAHGTFRLRDDRQRGHRLERHEDAYDCDVQSGGLDPANEPGGVAGCQVTASIIDVLVIYTPAARDQWGGAAAIEAEIETMVTYVNDAYGNSGVLTTVELVHIEEVDASGFVTLNELRVNGDGVVDDAHLLRTAYAADIVVLVNSGQGGSSVGLSQLLMSAEADAFCIIGISSTPSVLGHELGHQLGGCHAIGDGGGCDINGGLLFEFSNGHRFTGDSGSLWRTVMAYPAGVRVPYISTPGVTFDGQPTGIADGSPDAADNVTTFNAARGLVSAFRCHDETCSSLDLSSQEEDCNGNGVPDLCDIAQGWELDENNNGVPDPCDPPPPANDQCGSAQFVVAGSTAINNEHATADGPDELACGPEEVTEIRTDVWYRMFSSTAESITIDACDTDFNAAIAVYSVSCPTASEESIACDSQGCAGGARVTFDAAASTFYRIRIGSLDGSTGNGTLEITIGAPDCVGDTDGNGAVDVDDIINVILDWDTDGSLRNGDVDGNGLVNVDDLVMLILAFGAC